MAPSFTQFIAYPPPRVAYLAHTAEAVDNLIDVAGGFQSPRDRVEPLTAGRAAVGAAARRPRFLAARCSLRDRGYSL